MKRSHKSPKELREAFHEAAKAGTNTSPAARNLKLKLQRREKKEAQL